MNYVIIKHKELETWQVIGLETGTDFFQLGFYKNVYFQTKKAAQKAVDWWLSGGSDKALVETDTYAYAMLQSFDPSVLKHRFKWTVSVMYPHMKKHFKELTFDFENKRCFGNGAFYLQWSPRAFPDIGIGYNNQQTGNGHIEIIAKDKLK